MKVVVTIMIVRTFETIPKSGKESRGTEIRVRIETVLTPALGISVRILRKVLESKRNLLSLRLQ